MIFNRVHRFAKGFTLAELLIVVAIIGILAGVAIPTFTGSLEKAKATVCQSNRRDFYTCYQLNHVFNEENADNKEAINTALSQAGTSGTISVTGEDNSLFRIVDLCGAGGNITAVCGKNGSIMLVCDKHPGCIGSADTTGSATQSGDFILDVAENGGQIANKGDFYADYYSSHSAVKMTDEYKQKIVDAGLHSSLKNADFYWWTYPKTDKYGNVLYMVTYANTQSDPANWTNNNRHSMDSGYVVIVNGKTYIRTQSGATVQPGYSANSYDSLDVLEAALIANSYKVVP